MIDVRRVAVAFIAIAFALTPQLVLAHAQLLSTDPAAGTIVQTAPARVTLVFSEPVTPASFGIKVYAPSGDQVASPVQSHAAVMSAGVAATAQGTYVVLWQGYAADTHPSRGAFEFSVGAASANPYSGLLD